MQAHKIQSITRSKYQGNVLNLEVETDNSYVTEAFIVHNCDPSRADSAFFDRLKVDHDISTVRQAHRESAGVKYWVDYQPHHRYGIGADTSEGIGKDANTMALWDFGSQQNDISVLGATYFNNRIPPDLFGHELKRVGQEFGNCIIAPEANNTGHATIAAMRGYPNIFTERKEGNRTI